MGYAVAPNSATAAEDAYLKALAEEAKRSAKLTSKPAASPATTPTPKESPATTAAPAPVPVKTTPTNSEFQTQFEQMLENERPATYHFYKQLPDPSKSSVVQIYKDSNKISTASKKVFDLYFKQMKK